MIAIIAISSIIAFLLLLLIQFPFGIYHICKIYKHGLYHKPSLPYRVLDVAIDIVFFVMVGSNLICFLS